MEFARLSIETLTREQFDQIVDIENNCGLEPYSPEGLLECIADLDTFACFDGDKVIGFITAHICGRYFGHEVYIVNINVTKACRGQGIAKKLMYAVYEYYIQNHADMLVSLDVDKSNNAMELYKKVGFQIADIPSRNGDADVVMVMPLSMLGTRIRRLLAKEEYLQNPCRAASIPYWKAVRISVPENMKILHQDDFCADILEQYADEPYFRLIHDLQTEPAPVPEGYSLCQGTAEEFAAHIQECYGNGMTAAEVRGFTEREVYCSELWLALRDDRTGRIVATGIGELDREIGESILEWIQVSDEYRGHGLGSYIVTELLWRMKGKAKFATVSGQCDNPTNPEALYRKCGFAGNDVWHVLRKR